MEQELQEHTHILQSLQTKVKELQLSMHCGGFEGLPSPTEELRFPESPGLAKNPAMIRGL